MLTVAFLGFEFAIVSSIPLETELEPDNRSAVLGLGIGLSTAARAGVSLVAGATYVELGFRATMIVATALAAGAALVMTVVVDEPGGTTTTGGRNRPLWLPSRSRD